MAALDFHTDRVRYDKSNQFYEFGSSWMRCPIEVLLLYKLRQELGLPNPEVDHPLTETPLGRLPPETGFQPDDLLRRVHARMVSQGFDDQAIIALAE